LWSGYDLGDVGGSVDDGGDLFTVLVDWWVIFNFADNTEMWLPKRVHHFRDASGLPILDGPKNSLENDKLFLRWRCVARNSLKLLLSSFFTLPDVQFCSSLNNLICYYRSSDDWRIHSPDIIVAYL